MGPPAGPGLVVLPLFDVPAGGEALVAGYGFTGHGRNEAAGELVERAIAMGYLSYGEEMLEAWSGETACDPNRSCLLAESAIGMVVSVAPTEPPEPVPDTPLADDDSDDWDETGRRIPGQAEGGTVSAVPRTVGTPCQGIIDGNYPIGGSSRNLRCRLCSFRAPSTDVIKSPNLYFSRFTGWLSRKASHIYKGFFDPTITSSSKQYKISTD